MYRDGAFPELKERDFNGSWLDWFLKEIETFHGASWRSRRSSGQLADGLAACALGCPLLS